jgi:polyhydroxyalkanoate synthesis regulator phasin
MAQEAWRAYLELAIGATDATRKKATKAVKQLVGKGAVSGEQLQSMAEDLLRTSSASREAMANLVRFELDKALGRIGLATADEVSALNAKVRDLEAKLRAATAVPPGAIESVDGPPVGAEVIAKGAVAKKTVAKKTTAKKAVAKKAVAKKAVAKKAVAKKVVAKKTAPPAKVAKKTAVAPAPAGAEPLAPPAAKKAVKRVAAVKKAAAAKKAAGGAS